MTLPVPPVAVNFWLYATPQVSAGRELGLRERAGLMTSEQLSVALLPALSVVITLNGNVPLAVGVPLKVPLLGVKGQAAGKAAALVSVTLPVPPAGRERLAVRHTDLAGRR